MVVSILITSKVYYKGGKGNPVVNPFLKREVQIYMPGDKASHLPAGLSGKQLPTFIEQPKWSRSLKGVLQEQGSYWKVWGAYPNPRVLGTLVISPRDIRDLPPP